MQDRSLSRFCFLAGLALIAFCSSVATISMVATVGIGDSMIERFIVWFTASLPWSFLLSIGLGIGTVLFAASSIRVLHRENRRQQMR